MWAQIHLYWLPTYIFFLLSCSRGQTIAWSKVGTRRAFVCWWLCEVTQGRSPSCKWTLRTRCWPVGAQTRRYAYGVCRRRTLWHCSTRTRWWWPSSRSVLELSLVVHAGSLQPVATELSASGSTTRPPSVSLLDRRSSSNAQSLARFSSVAPSRLAGTSLQLVCVFLIYSSMFSFYCLD